jgi:hypothetical protein
MRRWLAISFALSCSHAVPPPAPLAVPAENASQPAQAPVGDGGGVAPIEAGGGVDAGAVDAGDAAGADAGGSDAGLADGGAGDGGTAMLLDLASPITAAGLETAVGLDWTPEARAQPASKTFKNLKLLGELRSERFMAAMQSMRANLGQKCAMCHLVDQKDFASDQRKEKRRAREMIRMTAEIDRRTFDGHLSVTCFTCHRGDEKPPKMTFSKDLPPGFAQHLTPEQLTQPATKVFRDVRILKDMDARNFGLIMGWFATELGVKCTHCHQEGDFAADTPKKIRARQMLEMTDYIAKGWYHGNDSPIGCGTCHRGKLTPARTPKDIP